MDTGSVHFLCAETVQQNVEDSIGAVHTHSWSPARKPPRMSMPTTVFRHSTEHSAPGYASYLGDPEQIVIIHDIDMQKEQRFARDRHNISNCFT
jgi:hypothetical protein